MTWSLLDARGQRKYLTPAERRDFIQAAFDSDPLTKSFCLTLAMTGGRISEILSLTAERVDQADKTIVIESLKRRRRGIFRSVPVPLELIECLVEVHSLPACGAAETRRLWTFSRPTAWKRVAAVMSRAGIPPALSKPKSLRHAFAVEAVQKRIALSVVKKWLGHAKIETTAIYADPVGEEERALASLLWEALPERKLTRADIRL